MPKQKPLTAIEQLQFVTGQLAAMDALLHALLAVIGRQDEVEKAFNQHLSMAAAQFLRQPDTPQSFNAGFVHCAEAIRQSLASSQTPPPGSAATPSYVRR